MVLLDHGQIAKPYISYQALFTIKKHRSPLHKRDMMGKLNLSYAKSSALFHWSKLRSGLAKVFKEILEKKLDSRKFQAYATMPFIVYRTKYTILLTTSIQNLPRVVCNYMLE